MYNKSRNKEHIYKRDSYNRECLIGVYFSTVKTFIRCREKKVGGMRMAEYNYHQTYVVTEPSRKEKVKETLSKLMRTNTFEEVCELLEISEDYAHFILA